MAVAHSLEIAATWDGRAIDEDERVRIDLARAQDDLVLRVDAPYHGDPAPARAAGSLDGLWNYEVVELFLAGPGDSYLEIELGAHGHYLLLLLRGVRRVVEQGMKIDYRVEARGRRWRGEARIPVSLLPDPITRANAYAIHGTGDERRYLALHRVPGDLPDFHRLDCFAPIELPVLQR